MSDLDPERFTLRQAAQARDDFAMVMEELGFVKAQIARLPTRRHQAFTPLRIVVTTAFGTATLVILWFELSGGTASDREMGALGRIAPFFGYPLASVSPAPFQ